MQHVTLKSIANNPDIHEGMSREEIDAAIKRHADFEMLYDKPYEDKKQVRVAGPVHGREPVAPPLLPSPAADDANRRRQPSATDADAEAPTFEQSILDNLRKAGHPERPQATSGSSSPALEPYAGTVHPGRRRRATTATTTGTPSRVGIAIGPQYGTVSPAFIKDAAREAIRAVDFDLLCVLGFAFDPQATEVTEGRRRHRRAADEGFANVAAERSSAVSRCCSSG